MPMKELFQSKNQTKIGIDVIYLFQNASYRQTPSSLFSGYNNDTTHHQNKIPGTSSGPGGPSGPGGSSVPGGQAGRQASGQGQGIE